MSLSEAKAQVRQFFAALYHVDFDEPLGAASGEDLSIDVLSGDLEGEAEWDLADLEGGPSLCSRATIQGDYGRFREVHSIWSFIGCEVNVGGDTWRGCQSRVPILEVRVGALELTFLYNST